MYDVNTLASQTPTRRGPCSFRENRPSTTSNATSSSVTTTRDRDAHQAQHHITSNAHEGAPEARAQHYEKYDARSVLKHHCTTSPFSAAPLLMPARATHCGGSGQLFRG
ncbi:hypothetical protein DFH09DRAFT_1328921 [Mycena vulgaris]|nr:hypothetical protein DFH09DRAFT_1328921 [Mycena vulgaris]